MSLYRVKQFYWSITSRIDLDDTKLLDNYLEVRERQLFDKLSIYEQKHCINVTRDVIRMCKENNIDDDLLIKVSLLHDIGKTCKRLNPIEKSLIVIIDSVSKGKAKRFKNLKQIDVYYNHGDKGYKILKKFGNYSERFLYLVKNHHNNCIIGDIELNILRTCDSNN